MGDAVAKDGRSTLVIQKGAKGDAYQFVGSTEDPDRDGDVIRLAGWDTAHFEQNPVVFYGHDYRGNSVKFPIGTATVTKDEAGKRLLFSITFTDAHEDAKTVKALVDDGVLRATSVGFMPKKMNLIVDPESQQMLGREFVEQELLEISIVPIPANPNAVRLALSKGLMTETKAVEWGLLEVKEFGEVLKRVDALSVKLEALEQFVKGEVARLDAKAVPLAETEADANQDSKQVGDYFESLLSLSKEAAGQLVPAVNRNVRSEAAEIAAILKGKS